MAFLSILLSFSFQVSPDSGIWTSFLCGAVVGLGAESDMDGSITGTGWS